MQRTTKHFQINALALAIAMSTISAHAETDQQTSEYGTLPTIKVKAESGEENEKLYSRENRNSGTTGFIRS